MKIIEATECYIGERYPYWKWPKVHTNNFRLMASRFAEVHGDVSVRAIGPKKVQEYMYRLANGECSVVLPGFRKAVAAKALNLTTVNCYKNRLVSLANWLWLREEISYRQVEALRAVPNYRKGRCPAAPPRPKRIPSDEEIMRCIEYCDDVLDDGGLSCDVLHLIFNCGARVLELARMTESQIDRNVPGCDGVWVYVPNYHKTQNLTDKDRTILLGPVSQEIVTRRLSGTVPPNIVDRAVFRKADGSAYQTGGDLDEFGNLIDKLLKKIPQSLRIGLREVRRNFCQKVYAKGGAKVESIVGGHSAWTAQAYYLAPDFTNAAKLLKEIG